MIRIVLADDALATQLSQGISSHNTDFFRILPVPVVRFKYQQREIDFMIRSNIDHYIHGCLDTPMYLQRERL